MALAKCVEPVAQRVINSVEFALIDVVYSETAFQCLMGQQLLIDDSFKLEQ